MTMLPFLEFRLNLRIIHQITFLRRSLAGFISLSLQVRVCYVTVQILYLYVVPFLSQLSNFNKLSNPELFHLHIHQKKGYF